MKTKKPTRKQLLQALYNLTQFASGNGESRQGNPYTKKAVIQACTVLANEQGLTTPYSWNETTPKFMK